MLSITISLFVILLYAYFIYIYFCRTYNILILSNLIFALSYGNWYVPIYFNQDQQSTDNSTCLSITCKCVMFSLLVNLARWFHGRPWYAWNDIHDGLTKMKIHTLTIQFFWCPQISFTNDQIYNSLTSFIISVTLYIPTQFSKFTLSLIYKLMLIKRNSN